MLQQQRQCCPTYFTVILVPVFLLPVVLLPHISLPVILLPVFLLPHISLPVILLPVFLLPDISLPIIYSRYFNSRILHLRAFRSRAFCSHCLIAPDVLIRRNFEQGLLTLDLFTSPVFQLTDFSLLVFLTPICVIPINLKINNSNYDTI